MKTKNKLTISAVILLIATLELSNENIIQSLNERISGERLFIAEVLSEPQNYDLSDSTVIDILNGSETYHVVTATIYRPKPEECWGDPFITADNSRIDSVKLESGKLKWCAVSGNLLEKYPYGSKINVIIDNEDFGVWEVHDTMNKRYADYIDLLYPKNKIGNKWRNVLIAKVED